jgi:hypothetical protein
MQVTGIPAKQGGSRVEDDVGRLDRGLAGTQFQRQPAQRSIALGGTLFGRDILHDRDDEQQVAPRTADRGVGGAGPDDPAILPHKAFFPPVAVLLARGQFPKAALTFGVVVGMRHPGRAQARQFLVRIAQHLLVGPIGLEKATVGAVNGHGDGRQFKEGAKPQLAGGQPVLALVQLGLHPLALGQVHMGTHHAERLAVGIAQHRTLGQDPAVGVVLVLEPEFEPVAAPRIVQAPAQLLQGGRKVIGMDAPLPFGAGAVNCVLRMVELTFPLRGKGHAVGAQIPFPEAHLAGFGDLFELRRTAQRFRAGRFPFDRRRPGSFLEERVQSGNLLSPSKQPPWPGTPPTLRREHDTTTLAALAGRTAPRTPAILASPHTINSLPDQSDFSPNNIQRAPRIDDLC